MTYKTIALELLQDSPDLYERLRSTKRLLPTMDAYAIELKAAHELWKAEITRRNPGSDPAQVAAEALELAIEDLKARLPCESPEDEAAPLSLDAAMDYLKRRTPAG